MSPLSGTWRYSSWWCRLVTAAPFVVLGALALTACGSADSPGDEATAADGAGATAEAGGASDEAEEQIGDDPADEPEPGDDGGDEGEPSDEGEADGGDEAEVSDEGEADGEGVEADGGAAEGELFPDVLDVTATLDADGTWTFATTLSSPYDTPERYADAWRVVGPDGAVYGERILTHDHANEQPFTRSQSGIEIPDDVGVVTVEGRDQVSGWGGATVEVELPR